jgi:hypothetical protein
MTPAEFATLWLRLMCDTLLPFPCQACAGVGSAAAGARMSSLRSIVVVAIFLPRRRAMSW